MGLTAGTTSAFQLFELGDLTDVSCGALGDLVSDIKQIEAADSGVTQYDYTETEASLFGAKNIIGRSLVISTDSEDASTRLACCVIGRAKRGPIETNSDD